MSENCWTTADLLKDELTRYQNQNFNTKLENSRFCVFTTSIIVNKDSEDGVKTTKTLYKFICQMSNLLKHYYFIK